MPITDEAGEAVLRDGHGVPVARFEWSDEGGERFVRRFRAEPGIAADRAARLGVLELAGLRFKTTDEETARALIGAGCTLVRAATDMERFVEGSIPDAPLADGWALVPHQWDDDLAAALWAAYGPDHPDRSDRVGRLRGLTEGEGALAVLPGATARLRGPDWRSAGQVFTVGPVPWAVAPTAWVLDLAVNPGGQGRGFGAALLAYAIRGTRNAGLTTVGLSVTDGNPARRLYDRMGFRPVLRHFEVRAPRSPAGTL
jgi:ribosomal protein S18 acetylase RimI-like enzyme